MNAQTESKTVLPVFAVVGYDILYSRVSTDDQVSNTSLPDQEAKCRDYLERLGLDNVLVFKEDYSGFEFNRPELSKILDLMRQGKVRSFTALRVDRICRSTSVLERLREQYFKPLNIEVHTLDLMQWQWSAAHESIQDNLCLMGSFWGKILVEVLQNGRKRHVLNGNPMTAGKPPLGLKEVVEFDAKGKRIGAHFEFDEFESAIVVRIFADIIDNNLSLAGLADKLNAEKIPTYTELRGLTPFEWYQKSKSKSGHKWRPGTIRQILRNTVYDGRWYFGKTKSVKVRGDDGLPVIRDNGKVKTKTLQIKDNLILVEIEPLIPHDVWQAAQDKLDKNREEKRGRQPKHEYLLAKRIRCECGYAMTVQAMRNGRYRYYHCLSVNKNFYNAKCGMGFINAKLVDAIAWGWLYKLLSDKNEIRDRIEQYADEKEKTLAPVYERLAFIAKSLEKKQATHSAMLNSLFKLPEMAQAKTLTLITQAEEEIKETQQEQTELESSIEEEKKALAEIKKHLAVLHRIKNFERMNNMPETFPDEEPSTYDEKLKYVNDFDLRVVILSDKKMHVTCKVGSEVLNIDGNCMLSSYLTSNNRKGFCLSFSDVLTLDYTSFPQFEQVERTV